jgi:hypothetical protein
MIKIPKPKMVPPKPVKSPKAPTKGLLGYPGAGNVSKAKPPKKPQPW